MTTDPRVIECQQELYRAFMEDAVKRYGFVDDTGGDLQKASKDIQASYDVAVVACILKWLEQEPSRLMCHMGADHGGERFADGNADAVYTAMNAQAAKEIGGE